MTALVTRRIAVSWALLAQARLDASAIGLEPSGAEASRVPAARIQPRVLRLTVTFQIILAGHTSFRRSRESSAL